MFFIFSEFGLISEASSGQNRIPRAVFMLGDGSISIGNEFLMKIDFFMKICSHMAILRQTFLVRVSSPGHIVCSKLQHFYCSFDIRNR